jgi:GNAT superfamily N-acetyltransferase
MIRYCKIKNTNTKEIHGLIKSFCEETGADAEAYDTILDRLPKMHVFAAVADGVEGIVGIVGFYLIADNKAVGDFTYIVPSHRNSSLGGRLHHMAMDYARSIGIKTVAVFTKPETANRFKKLGYKEAMYVLEKAL